ncbi:MAG: hypothetical protein FJX62_12775 [Alphaproteobacteria bacterium]|nr:hypothetical protein [Alphaproteobacteria bacterium]
MARDNVTEASMQRRWGKLGLGEFVRTEFERQRAYINWKREHWRAMEARDEAERLPAQQDKPER